VSTQIDKKPTIFFLVFAMQQIS